MSVCAVCQTLEHSSTDGPSKTRILHDIYTDGQSCRLEALLTSLLVQRLISLLVIVLNISKYTDK